MFPGINFVDTWFYKDLFACRAEDKSPRRSAFMAIYCRRMEKWRILCLRIADRLCKKAEAFLLWTEIIDAGKYQKGFKKIPEKQAF